MADLSNPLLEDLVNDAVKFHGHLGPFLILGLKAGLFANETLGKDYFETRVIVETEDTPPCSCVVDGLQFTTGCTMGKGNIELKKGHSLHLLFTKGNKTLKLSLKDTILRSLKDTYSHEDRTETALKISKRPIQELFDIVMK
ncbi:MAG: formylmethanofuran dehydrogenase subunit E family protein [Candidatus Bathyarchaeota archaeon]|nr:formylmethanofuran dehydrogenase subunit E family protein [Candidatus Bathyarchaeota archaeon]